MEIFELGPWPIDGELIVLDGKAYQAKGSGESQRLWKRPRRDSPLCGHRAPSGRSDFSSALEMTDEELEARIESYYDGENCLVPLGFTVIC